MPLTEKLALNQLQNNILEADHCDIWRNDKNELASICS